MKPRASRPKGPVDPGRSCRWTQALALAGAISMSFSQPLFDVLAKNTGLLTAHGLTETNLITFAVVIGAAVPLAFALSFLVLDRAGSLGTAYAAVVFSIAGASFTLLCLRRFLPLFFSTAWYALPIATALGLLVSGLLMSKPPARQFVGLLAIGVFMFPAMFLNHSAITPLLEDQDSGAPELATALDQRPVVVLVFDELPVSTLVTLDEQIDGDRFPNFAALASTSTFYRRTLAASESTTYAIPSMLTGRVPRVTAEPVAANYPNNLFRWFGASGYDLIVSESLSRLCPDDLCPDILARQPLGEKARELTGDLLVVFAHLIAPESWAERLPPVDQTWAGFLTSNRNRDPEHRSTTAVPGVVDGFLNSINSRPRNRLYYLHLNLPHVPWKYLASGKEYGPFGQSVRPNGVIEDTWTDDEWLTLQGYQQHLLQTMYADRILGQLTARLRNLDLFEEALVIVTSDHGTSFWPNGPRRGMQPHNVEDILEVPLLVKFPNQMEGRVDDRPAQTLDLVPTIGEVLKSPVPWQTDGSSLLGPPASNRVRFLSKVSDPGPQVVTVSSERRRRTLERKHQHFGSGDASLHSIGAYPELLGRPTAELRIEPSTGNYRVLDAWALDDVKLDSDFVPARVYAEIDNEASWLAVSLNGVIRSVTRSFEARNRRWFTAMIEESAFIAGRNELAVFEIGPDAPRVLRRLNSQSAAKVWLVHSANTVTAISTVGSDGSEQQLARIIPNAVDGKLFLKADRIEGWASSTDANPQPYSELFLFRGEELLVRGAPARSSADWHPTSFAGFRIDLSREVLQDVSDLRLFARVGQVASELSTIEEPTTFGVLLEGSAVRTERGKLRFNTTEGRSIQVQRGVLVGSVIDVVVKDQELQITGWAAQRETRLPATSLILLVDGVPMSGKYQRIHFPAIASQHGTPRTSNYGFRVDINLSRVDAPREVRVRLFGVTDNDQAEDLQINGRRLAPAVQRVLANH